MTNRVDSVTLIAPSLNNEARAFSISHAERLLRIRDSGWKLPEDSNFEFDKQHGLRYKSNKRDTAQAKKEGHNRRG